MERPPFEVMFALISARNPVGGSGVGFKAGLVEGGKINFLRGVASKMRWKMITATEIRAR
jgi:hypothetical protein